ncbi:alpha/beta hydrolase [Micromonospora zhanjiangensis]|uniref:Alpha/beta hydrolase n=1 Tax=Micromonospora zhanjiangensis TaxID=1522057 RepID=A0ABV8KSN8_9ACTN
MDRTPVSRTSADTIVLIHGLWLSSRSWERWIDHYQAAGFRVLAPAWPGMDRSVEELRADPAPIAALTVRKIVDHYDRIVRELPRPPIIMGHSFGGSITQVLIDRGLGAAGVAIDSAPVKGVVRVAPAELRSVFPVLRNPANRHRAVPLTFRQFHYAFTNTLDEGQARPLYERYHVPAAGHVLFEGVLANLDPHSALDVSFGNNHRPPLLLTAGTADHVVPFSVTRSNALHHRRSSALTGFRQFPGRSHFLVGEQGWAEIADYALEWAIEATSPHLTLSG